MSLFLKSEHTRIVVVVQPSVLWLYVSHDIRSAGMQGHAGHLVLWNLGKEHILDV